jgi:2-polyprenyl-3-methyl-5-hydroxy-6-metoxy-1,4-benzoquinol methylase
MSPPARPAGGDPPETRSAVASELSWYHTIELPDGTVTPGFADTRGALAKVPMPESLEGKRCLDVGTADGFWAFAMEKRGAKEVVAIDVDDPTKRDWPWPAPPRAAEAGGRKTAFEFAHRALGSNVQRIDTTVYDLSPDAVGRFDFVFLGDLLLHLRDPVRALAAIRDVLDGELLVSDVVSMALTLFHPIRPTARFEIRYKPRWWVPNTAGLRAIVAAAGYEVTSYSKPYFVSLGTGYTGRGRWVRVLRSRGPRIALQEAGLRTIGAPHAWVLARPIR